MAADRVPEAEKVLKRALADSGGLTMKSNLSDIATRYDLAQASLMAGKRDEARTYLAYTGAGRESVIRRSCARGRWRHPTVAKYRG